MHRLGKMCQLEMRKVGGWTARLASGKALNIANANAVPCEPECDTLVKRWCMTSYNENTLAWRYNKSPVIIRQLQPFGGSFSAIIPIIVTSIVKPKSGCLYFYSTKNNRLFPFSRIAYHTDHRYKTMKTTGSDSSTFTLIWVHFLYNTWPGEKQQHK